MDRFSFLNVNLKLYRSKKSKRLSPLLIDSDSDVQSNGNDNCDKVSVKDEDDDVKEILESSDSEDSEIFKPSKRRRKKKSSDKSNDESESDQKTYFSIFIFNFFSKIRIINLSKCSR